MSLREIVHLLLHVAVPGLNHTGLDLIDCLWMRHAGGWSQTSRRPA